MAQLKPCLVCGGGPHQEPQQLGDGVSFDCQNCGNYWLSNTAVVVLRDKPPPNRPLLAHFIRRRWRPSERVKVLSELVEAAFATEARYPNAAEQVENLVIWLAENVPYPGQPTTIKAEALQAVVGAATREAFKWVVKSAMHAGWLSGQVHETLNEFELSYATLTLPGWSWYESKGRRAKSRVAFMAMQYGDAVLDAIVDDHFRAAVAQTGFTLRRLDDQPAAGLIDNRLRVEIRRARLMICDLTHRNLGAYWEAGFAEGIGIPVIYTCEQSKLVPGQIHFDTRNCQIVPWTVEHLAEATETLKATIRNTLPEEALLTDP
jgi:hypothetical protein